MNKKMMNKVEAKGHRLFSVNTVSGYIKKANGEMINITKIGGGIFKVWGAFNNMTPEAMTEESILGLC